MFKYALRICVVATLAAASVAPAAAASWTKGYVVSFYDPAFRYGGRAGYTYGKLRQPGIDCPRGNATHFTYPEQVAETLSLVRWRTPDEIEAIANPPINKRYRDPAGIYFHTWRAASAYRGYTPDIETYINPFAAEDPGQPQVTSRIGEGFNLDGKIKPHDFVSPDGERGIDNQLYRAWGCDAPWRGSRDSPGTLVLRSNDKMLEGLFTIVIRISGNQDPMNDDDATLEIGYSPDQIEKNALGEVGLDYSYRILRSEMYTKLKAQIKGGVVETEQATIHMPPNAWFYNQIRDANFREGKLRVTLLANGNAEALVGGYRDWRDVYSQNIFSQSGGDQGIREHEDHVGLYYALRRHADGLFNEETGRYDGISSAYRMSLTPAYVVDPVDIAMEIPVRDSGVSRQGYDDTTAAMIKGVDTLVPQDVPASSSELKPVDGIAIGPGGVVLRLPGQGRWDSLESSAAAGKKESTEAEPVPE